MTRIRTAALATAAALAIDTASIDRGQSKDFKAHQILNAANRPSFENVANVEKLPPTGATFVALPLKIEGGSGGPARIRTTPLDIHLIFYKLNPIMATPRAYNSENRLRKQAELRARIAEAAASLHARQGALATSYADIAAEAKVSLPTVYAHFPTMEALLDGCTRHVADRAPALPVEAILGANVFKDVFAGIRDIVGGRSATYERELKRARDMALAELEAQAQQLGANAVVGVDLDYEVLGANNGMLMVSASGTAVLAE